MMPADQFKTRRTEKSDTYLLDGLPQVIVRLPVALLKDPHCVPDGRRESTAIVNELMSCLLAVPNDMPLGDGVVPLGPLLSSAQYKYIL